MKKATLLIASLTLGVSMTFAQTITSGKGENYLPDDGDWSMGADATPFLDYLGNFFGKNHNSYPPSFGFLNYNQMIMGKYFTEATVAYRASLRIGFGSTTTRAPIIDATATSPTFPARPTMKEDSWKTSSTYVGLAIGMEKRRGKTRLQGYGGGMTFLWREGYHQKYEYGNAMTPASTASSISTNFGSNINPPVTYGSNARTLSQKQSTLGVGLRAFIGAEYFVLPKVSVGAEFGWGVGVSYTGRSKIEYEAAGGGPASVATAEELAGWQNLDLEVDTDNNYGFIGGSGSLIIQFHLGN